MTNEQKQRIDHWQLHPSQRGQFAFELYKAMANNRDIMCFTADLGFGVLDPIRDDMPDRFVNFMASEQCMVGAAVGATLSGRLIFCYSITSFLIYRPYEVLRNYVNHEGIPVRLVGSGYGDDYKHDGITHQPHEIKKVMETLPRISTHFPTSKESIPYLLDKMIKTNRPSFLCLRR